MSKRTVRIKRRFYATIIAVGLFFGVWFGKDSLDNNEDEEPPDESPIALESPVKPYKASERIGKPSVVSDYQASLNTVSDVTRSARAYLEEKAAEAHRQEDVVRHGAALSAAEERRALRETTYKERLEREREQRRKERAAAQQEQSTVPSRGSSYEGAWQTFEATYYGANCAGCSGVTATGINVSNTIYAPSGHRVIAVDPNQIPLGSLVEVSTPNGTFKAVAGDTGGAIKGRIIDILVGSESESAKYGRHSVKLRILN